MMDLKSMRKKINGMIKRRDYYFARFLTIFVSFISFLICSLIYPNITILSHFAYITGVLFFILLIIPNPKKVKIIGLFSTEAENNINDMEEVEVTEEG